MPKTLSLLAVLKKIDAKGVKSLSDAQWNTFLASDTEPNEIKAKITKLEGYELKGAAYDKTGELIPEDNDAMIERFRQRTGRAQGRESLKVKKSKIDVKSFKENFLDKDEEPVKPDTTGTSTLTKFQPPALNPDLSLPEGEEKKEETEGLKGIRDVLDDILKVLRLDFKGDRKEARDSQKEAARKKRGKREDKLEGVGKAAGGIGKAISAMVKPFSSIWDTVMNFVKTVIIGVLLNKILKWFGNPKNQDKIKSLGKFFRDWWPALTTAALLFLTPLGGLVKGVVGLLTAIIPKLVMAIAANPWAAAAVLGGVAIYSVAKMAGGKKKEKPKEDVMDIPQPEMEESGEGITTMSGGGVVPQVVDAPKSAQNFIQKYNQGGLVQHFNEGGFANITNTETTSSTDSDGNFSFGMNYVSPEEAKERVAAMGMPSMELMDGTVVPDFGKMGGESLTQGLQLTRDIMVENGAPPQKIAQVDELMAMPDAQPESIATRINQLVPGSMENTMMTVGDDISAKAKMSGGGSVKGFNTGGKVPGSGNKDTVPAMLTPGEFVMSKGAVHKYGTDTLENMNAAAGASGRDGATGASGPAGAAGKEGTVPAMLTPGEFVVSAPAVQQYGVDTMESMNAMGGGNNKPEFKEPNVEVNNGGLINNYRKMQSNHYSTGGVVKYFQSGGLVQYLQGGGEVNQPKGMMRFLAGAADVATGGVFDFDKRGSMADGAKSLVEKMAPGKPNVQQGENKTITLPTIPKQDQSRTRSNSDIPQFRINIESSQRSMVISSLGISDLMGG